MITISQFYWVKDTAPELVSFVAVLSGIIHKTKQSRRLWVQSFAAADLLCRPTVCHFIKNCTQTDLKFAIDFMFIQSVVLHLKFKSISSHFISCFGINC